MGRLEDIFRKNESNLIYKWMHYFDIYERFFERYVGKEVIILEIGVFQGGSLQMWKEYFGPKAKIYGVDINPECKKLEEEGIEILIGSQEDPSFWQEVKAKVPKIDILIDDGGHTMKQQIVTFEEMFAHVKDDGVYLCEDTHTSYLPGYGGFLRGPGSFIEMSKDRIDSLAGWHFNRIDKYTRSIKSITFSDSVVVFEKAPVREPEAAKSGKDKNIEAISGIRPVKSGKLLKLKILAKRIAKAFDFK